MLETKQKLYDSSDVYILVSELLSKYSSFDDTVFDKIFQIIDSNPEELIYTNNELSENIHYSFSDNDSASEVSVSEDNDDNSGDNNEDNDDNNEDNNENNDNSEDTNSEYLDSSSDLSDNSEDSSDSEKW